MDFQIQMGGLGQRSKFMKKNKHYEFVLKKECNPYIERTTVLIEALIKKLQSLGINAKYYIIGSAGKRNLVTCLVVNGKKLPIDLDINLEVLTVSSKYKELGKLKEVIRSELNKVIREKGEKFSDGSNSSSVITVSLLSANKQLEFSFDIGIVSRNKNGDLQRLVLNKKNNNYTWNLVFGSSDIDQKFKSIRNPEDWNKLRNCYLKFKNQYMDDENHPSYICYKMAVEEVYGQKEEISEVIETDFDAINEVLEEPTVDNSLVQLNKLYTKGLISKPYFEFPDVDEDCEKSWRCECFVDSLKDYEGYFDYGIGEEDSKQEAKKAAACHMLRFLYENDDTFECPYCGALKSSENSVCEYCFDEG